MRTPTRAKRLLHLGDEKRIGVQRGSGIEYAAGVNGHCEDADLVLPRSAVLRIRNSGIVMAISSVFLLKDMAGIGCKGNN